MRFFINSKRGIIAAIFGIFVLFPAAFALADWRTATDGRAVLRGNTWEATFQNGFPCEIKSTVTGDTLLQIQPDQLPGAMPLFGPSHTVNFDAAMVKQEASDTSVIAYWRMRDGTHLVLRWLVTPDNDLVLRASAETAHPVDELRLILGGFDIAAHSLVWIDGYGVGRTANAPWSGIFLGDPNSDGSPSGFPQALVALFQGQNRGWFIEGRDERIGPACVMVKGNGNSATIGMDRRFAFPTTSAEMYEVRFRPYQNHWEDAVDPYIDWLQKGAGFVPLDKLPPDQAWVAKLKTQAYIDIGNNEGLDELAKRVNPSETFVGRQPEYRFYAMDVGYPDYRVTPAAKKWIRYARNLGFHVGVHFNSQSLAAMFPDLVARFRPALLAVGADADGKPQYDHIYEGKNALLRISAAYKPWRDYLIDQMKDAVDSGVDVIYLDESMAPGGPFVVDGVTGIQGVQLLMKEILERYPGVAVETEQFNALTAKFGKLALSQMPLGHPLSGYIFHNFARVVPEGVMYSPTDCSLMDAFDSWGFMMPGADPQRERSWTDIATAFHQYQLVPDSRLERVQFTHFVDHYSHGLLPAPQDSIPPEGEKLFGFQGANGVTAYFEKQPTKCGLVVYEPNKEPKWIGTRYFNIKSFAGPGMPAYFGFRDYMDDWLIYDGQTILGLNPGQSYWFDTTRSTSPTRFHVFKVPDSFVGLSTMEPRTAEQEIGPDDVYFCLRFAGQGQIGVYVPDNYDAYLNGAKLTVDPQSKQAFSQIDASATDATGLGYHIELSPDKQAAAAAQTQGPATLLAVRKVDTELNGVFSSLPWYGSRDALKWMKPNPENGFEMAVGTIGRVIGRIPSASSIHIQGEYQVSPQLSPPTDGVIRINGAEVLRIPPGDKPYKRVAFDQDITSYAGKYVCVEFLSDGSVRGDTVNFFNLKFEVKP